MKYFKILICTLLICALFTGCNLRISSSIDDLISPLSPFGDNADIKKALDEYTRSGYSLKIPRYGKHITSYTFFDIDGDKQDEAVAFYEPADNLGTTNMALIKKSDDKWKVIENIEGEGRDVYSLEFADVSGDKRSELFVSWDYISNSSNHILSVYRFGKGDKKIKKIGVGIPINNFIIADMVGDSVKEALLFEIDSGNSASAKAELYSFKNFNMKKLGETKLDSHITSYVSLKLEEKEDSARVYADAVGSDGDSMLTEVVFWWDTYGTIGSPFYSYTTGLTKDTKRKAMVPCIDINEDKTIDIPTDYSMGKLPKQIKAVNWKAYKTDTLIHTAYSLFAKNDNYVVVVPDKMVDSITVSYNLENHEMSVINKGTKQLIYSIMPVLKATYKEKTYDGYTQVLEASGYCYLAKLGTDSKNKVTVDELKSYIKSVD